MCLSRWKSGSVGLGTLTLVPPVGFWAHCCLSPGPARLAVGSGLPLTCRKELVSWVCKQEGNDVPEASDSKAFTG